MRIILIAHPSLGAKALEAIIGSGEEIVAVFAPGDNPEKPGPLKKLADEDDMPCHQPEHMKDSGVYETMAGYKPELGVLAFVADIIPQVMLNCPQKRTIMFHPSLLPRHRGGSAISWTIIQGESRTGLSIIWPNQGIDAGPILLQKAVAISPDDTAGSLFFDKLYPMGVNALVEAIQLIKQGKAPRIPQDESHASYEPLCRESDAIIDWAKPASQIYNLIRGANPKPGATTAWQGEKLKLFDSRLVKSSRAAPGEVVLVNDDSFTVAGDSGAIMVRRVKLAGSAKISAAEFIQQASLQKGDRLG